MAAQCAFSAIMAAWQKDNSKKQAITKESPPTSYVELLTAEEWEFLLKWRSLVASKGLKYKPVVIEMMRNYIKRHG